MSATNLCRVRSSISFTWMPVEFAIDNGHLIVEPAKPRYSLEELLAQCHTTPDMAADEREWLEADPVGRELLSYGAATSMRQPLRFPA